MTRRLKQPMPRAILEAQRLASDPSASVWVTANAGSGKTYVLTARVLRLLLSGVKPEEIICLTYTKAAAAEMRGRVAQRLAGWSLLPDGQLIEDIAELCGAPPTPAMLLRARSLFAHALETPGGLKIQTIHAFCEAVLHRFPQEAGVPFDFTVLEEHERDRLLLEAREQAIAAGLRGTGESLAEAVDTLFGLLSDFQIETAIIEALNTQRTLRRVLAHKAEAKAVLRRLVGNPRSSEAVARDALEQGTFPPREWPRLFAHVPPDESKTQRLNFSERLWRLSRTPVDVDGLLEAFLKDGREPYKDRCTTKITDALLADDVGQEHDRLVEIAQELAHARLVERSAAMLDIVAAISAHYEAAKRARSLLDFDDLIEKLSALLHDDAEGAWVRYKLDARISHILVDEGQDTNPEQWTVIDALVDDFFSGDSAADRPRTIFAVGDQKQSIFSFQGADPEEFIDARSRYGLSARAARLEVAVARLRHSFRTLPNVLAAVDAVFAQPALRAGILEIDPPPHETARDESGGLVTLWPPIKETEDDADAGAWPTTPPEAILKSAPRRVAERIAREIRTWLANKRPLGPRGRPVRPEDILILVQVRSVLFHEIIRALNQAGIPTPGADRLAVTTHIGVLDLMALGDVLANPADSLQLAALLRSPLFEVSEQDLYDLANPRPKDEWLWHTMERSSIPSVKAAARQLTDWRDRLDFERPINFFAEVLYAGGGLRKFRARLGAEIDDVMAEFLDLALAHERAPQPSLLGFLAELRGREVIIKRELGEAGTGVRVMTVHGAKGLEAPIVILADAASTEEGRDRRSIYMAANPPLFFHAPSKATHVPATLEHRDEAEAAQKAEYWRKLYVAMTRAEDELYVTGYLTKARNGEGSWYEAIAGALRSSAESVVDGEGNETALIYPREREAVGAPAVDRVAPPAPATLVLPGLPSARVRQIVRPSSADTAARPDEALETDAEAATQRRDPEAARREGVALHALLHHLSLIEPTLRPTVGAKAVPVLLPDDAGRHGAILGRALSILAAPQLAHLFGPASRAEVPILAKGLQSGRPVLIAGRIDRLVVTPSEVLIVDYKSDENVPRSDAEVPPGYARQLGLYALVAGQLFPDKAIAAGILWTSLESFMILPQSQLAQRVAGFTLK